MDLFLHCVFFQTFSSSETGHPDILSRLANETRSSIWDMLASYTNHKSSESTFISGILPPSHPISQTSTSSGDSSEDLNVEIKDIKIVDLQSYHVRPFRLNIGFYVYLEV